MATTKSGGRGIACCLVAGLCYLVSAAASWAVFSDPAIAADFDGGTHTANMGGVGILAAVTAAIGGISVISALWIGPAGPRIAGGVLVLVGLPLSWAALFALGLSQALPAR